MFSKLLPSSILCFLLPLIAAQANPVCVDGQTGYDTRQVQYFYNAFCEDLDIKGYVVDQQVYGFPMISLGFQPAAGSLCGVQNCLASYSNLVSTCQSSNNTIYGSGSLDAGCGVYNFIIGDGGVNAAGASSGASSSAAANSSPVTTVTTISTSTICPPPTISTMNSSTTSSLTSTTILTTTSTTTSSTATVYMTSYPSSAAAAAATSSSTLNLDDLSAPSSTIADSAASSTTSGAAVTETSVSLTLPPYLFSNSTSNATTTFSSVGSAAATSALTIDADLTGGIVTMVSTATGTGSTAAAKPSLVLTSDGEVVKASGWGLLGVALFFVAFL